MDHLNMDDDENERTVLDELREIVAERIIKEQTAKLNAIQRETQASILTWHNKVVHKQNEIVVAQKELATLLGEMPILVTTVNTSSFNTQTETASASASAATSRTKPSSSIKNKSIPSEDIEVSVPVLKKKRVATSSTSVSASTSTSTPSKKGSTSTKKTDTVFDKPEILSTLTDSNAPKKKRKYNSNKRPLKKNVEDNRQEMSIEEMVNHIYKKNQFYSKEILMSHNRQWLTAYMLNPTTMNSTEMVADINDDQDYSIRRNPDMANEFKTSTSSDANQATATISDDRLSTHEETDETCDESDNES
jgi:hypothetical protein